MSWVVAVFAAMVPAILGWPHGPMRRLRSGKRCARIIGEGPVAGARHRMGALYYDHLDAIQIW